MRGRLPAELSGRHVIFAIWQNSSTPDTYYSCSDVIFGTGSTPASTRPATGATRPAGGASTGTGAPVSGAPGAAAVAGIGSSTDPAGTRPAAAVAGDRGWPLLLGLGGVLLAAVVLVPVGLRLRSRTTDRRRRLDT
jgi:chitin-binding protein